MVFDRTACNAMTAFFYGIAKFILWLVFHIRLGLEVHGREHIPRRGAFILASNHVSFLDPPLVGVACPRRVRFAARADLYSHFWLGVFLRGVGAISLQRGEADIAAIRKVLASLRKGEGVAIFPEGTRQMDGKLGTAKRGIGFIAEASGVPVIPVLVRGSFEALPRHATRLRRSKIQVAFGPRIAYTKETFPAFGQEPSHTEGEKASVVAHPAGHQTQRHTSRMRHEHFAQLLTQQWRLLEEQLSH